MSVSTLTAPTRRFSVSKEPFSGVRPERVEPADVSRDGIEAAMPGDLGHPQRAGAVLDRRGHKAGAQRVAGEGGGVEASPPSKLFDDGGDRLRLEGIGQNPPARRDAAE